MCHFYIYMDVHNTRVNVNRIKVWADYFFSFLDSALGNVQFPISEEDIRQKMMSSAHEYIVLEKENEIYEKGDKF